MTTLLRRLVREEQGQDLVEYALLAAFIALSATAMLALIGPQINLLYTSVKDALVDANAVP